jgi:hypothetical protein
MALDAMPRQTGRCLGWHCLTTAQKFVVIFSCVIVGIVLLVAWMYYLGTVATSHRQCNAITLPGGRQIRRDPSLPANVALGQLPIAHQRPGHPTQILYQPVVYGLDQQQIVQAHPYLVTGPYSQAASVVYPQPAPFHGPGYIQVPMIPPALPNREPSRPPSSPSRLSQEEHLQPQKLTLQQRINQRLRLPALRVLHMPRLSRARETTHYACGRRDSANKDRVRDQTPTMSCQETPSADSPQTGQESPSPESNAATVHSDDYDEILSDREHQFRG